MSRPVTARTALSHWYTLIALQCNSAPLQNIRRAANKHSSTDPDETTTAVILIALPKAVESTIDNLPMAGTAWLALFPLDFDQFCAAICSPLRRLA